MKTFIFGLAVAALLFFCEPASAQNVNLNCFTGVSPFWAPCSSTNPLQTSGSGGGGGGGGAGGTFAPNGNFATLTATGSSASVALPTGSAVLFQNNGTTTVSCTLGIGSATATTNENLIAAGGLSLLLVGANTFGACIDQTGTASNLVVLSGGAVSTFGNNADGVAAIANGLIGVDAYLKTWNGATWDRLQGVTLGPNTDVNSLPVLSPTPSSSSTLGITAIVSAAAESSHVLKASAGNLYGVYLTNPSASGFLLVFNSTTVPGDGAVTPIECVPISASNTAFVNYLPGPPEVFSTGISAALSSTGCFTKTTSPTGFFHGYVK